MEELQPDYKVSFWGLPCYMVDDPDETYLWGTNWLFDLLLPVVTVGHNLFGVLTGLFFPDFENHFRFKVLESYRHALSVKLEEEE